MPLPVLPPNTPDEDSFLIRDVWNSNLELEFALISDIVDDYPYISMDTEFPGVAVRPVGTFKRPRDFNYQTLRYNANLLKLIQLGLSFSDEHGHHSSVADGGNNNHKFCVWQFNFQEFNINEDISIHESIELLKRSGIDFSKNNQDGIDARRFSVLLMSSGIVLNDSVHWVTFHSGYDFRYLLKLLTFQDLPETQDEFFELIKMYFPRVYDIKYLMKYCNNLHGGLNKLAEILEVKRIGVSHQAGSDSLLTCHTFMKLKEKIFRGPLDKCSGVLYGLDRDGGHHFETHEKK